MSTKNDMIQQIKDIFLNKANQIYVEYKNLSLSEESLFSFVDNFYQNSLFSKLTPYVYLNHDTEGGIDVEFDITSGTQKVAINITITNNLSYIYSILILPSDNNKNYENLNSFSHTTNNLNEFMECLTNDYLKAQKITLFTL